MQGRIHYIKYIYDILTLGQAVEVRTASVEERSERGMKRREVKSGRGKKHGRVANKGNYLVGNYIFVTDHAIRRYQERCKKVNYHNAQRAIVESVKRSRMIALTKYGGREIRENRGMLFVCELEGNCLSVITVLVSEVDIRFAI